MKTAKYNERKVMIDLIGNIMEGYGYATFLDQYKEYDWDTHEYKAPNELNEDGTPNEHFTDYKLAEKAVKTLMEKLDSLL